VAAKRLGERLREVKADEEDERRRVAYEKAKAERDKLAGELKAIYPPIEAQLRDLLPRMAENARVRGARGQGARKLPRTAVVAEGPDSLMVLVRDSGVE
jgi:hypothetical protein